MARADVRLSSLERAADDLVVLNAVNHSLRQEIVKLLLDIAVLREQAQHSQYTDCARQLIRSQDRPERS